MHNTKEYQCTKEEFDTFVKNNCASCIYLHEPNKKGQLICTSFEYAGLINAQTVSCCTDEHCDDYEPYDDEDTGNEMINPEANV